MKVFRRWGAPPIEFGLPEYEMTKLANYNAEKARGLLHDPQWEAYMAELQERFNAAAYSEGDGA